MKAYTHDILRTLRSPGVLIVLVLVTLIGVTPALFLGVGGQASNASSITWAYGYSSAGYEITAYLTNSIGSPVGGVTVDLNASTSPFGFGGGTSLGQSAKTDSGGIVHFTLPDDGSSGYFLILTAPSPFSSPTVSGNVVPLGPGTPGFGSNNVLSTTLGLFPVTSVLRVMMVGPTGGAPNGYIVGWAPAPGPGSSPPGTVFASLGVVGGYVTNFPLPLPDNLTEFPFIYTAILDPNGTSVLNTTILVGSFNGGPPNPGFGGVPASPGASLYVTLTAIITIFAPLLGIFAAYTTYARDRLTGVLDNVLVRPVSRGGLALSRFMAVAIALAVGLAVMIGVLELSLFLSFGAAFGPTAILPFLAGLMVLTLFFAGTTFVLAHVLRSPAGVMGAMVGVFLVLSILWTIIVTIGVAFTTVADPTRSQVATLHANMANPAQYPDIVTIFVIGNTSLYGPPVDLAAAGLTSASLVGLGIAWLFLPIVGFYLLARRRD